MATIKTKNGDCDLDELATVPIPRDALTMLLPESCADDIESNCSQKTIDQLGEALIEFGNALQAKSPPSLRLDFDIVEESGHVTGRVVVQGAVTQLMGGPNIIDVVMGIVKAVAEQNAYQSEEDAVRVTILTRWSQALLAVGKTLDNSSNSMLAAASLRFRQEKKKSDADSPDGENVDG